MTSFYPGKARKVGVALAGLVLASVTGAATAFPFFGSTDGGGGGGEPTFGLELNNAFDPLDRMYFRFSDLTFTALDSAGSPVVDPNDTTAFSFSATAIGGEVGTSNEFVDAAEWSINGTITGVSFNPSFIPLGQGGIPAFVAASGSSSLSADVSYIGGFSAPGDSDPLDLAFTLTDENSCNTVSNPSGSIDCTFQLEFDPRVPTGQPAFIYFPTFQLLQNQTPILFDTGAGQAALLHNACEVADPSNQGTCTSEYQNSNSPTEVFDVIGPKFAGRLIVANLPAPATLGLVLLCAAPLLLRRRRRAA